MKLNFKMVNIMYMILMSISSTINLLSQTAFPEDQLKKSELMAQLRFLASDELMGRQPGTSGCRVAARYIAEHFRAAGLDTLPGAEDYFQNAELVLKIKTIKADSIREKTVSTRNVIGFIRGTDPKLNDTFILLSAHYDHLGISPVSNPDADSIYNGARDNGMGVVALLSAVRVLAADPPRRSILFLASTGEESGMLGSRYFAAHSPVPLEKIVFNLNNDNAGFNDTTLLRIIGLERMDHSEIIHAGAEPFSLTCLPYPEQFQYLYSRTDNIAFAEKGIPGITVSTGFKQVDQEMVQFVHTVQDEADDTFNYSYLLNFSKAYTHIARKLANADVLPFWITGDPFEMEGLKRYSRNK